jgi:TRAPP trafficking subunit Trs65
MPKMRAYLYSPALNKGVYCSLVRWLSQIPIRACVLLINSYTDEIVTVYVVLRTSGIEEDMLRSYLSRLTIAIDAHAINKQQQPFVDGQPAHPSQLKELVYSSRIQDFEDPLIIVHATGGSKNSGKGHIMAVWKLNVSLGMFKWHDRKRHLLITLGRPRVRMQNALIVFSASANLKPVEQVKSESIEKYLPSQIPSDLNLLESFRDDPALASVAPQLSALRVSRVVPATQMAKEFLRPLRDVPQRAYRAVPAVSSRVRYSRLNTYASKASIIACLDFDVTPFLDCSVVLDQVNLTLNEGNAEVLTGPHGPGIPLICKPRDDVTFLYRLIPNGIMEMSSHKSNVRVLEVSINATALVTEDCHPRIEMKWRASVDFSTPLNPSFGGPGQHLQRTNRPSSLPVTHTGTVSKSLSTMAGSRPLALGPDTLPMGEYSHQRSVSADDLGLTITFSGPQDVRIGVVFQWEVFIVNRSSRPRKLALVAIPRRRKAETRRSAPWPPSTGGGRKAGLVTDAVVDENIVYAMQKSAVMEPVDLVCLSTDIRVG